MIDKITNFLTHAATIYTIIIGLITGIIGVYITYQNFIQSIEENQKQIEITQIMILKPLVRYAEKNPCPISDAEWDEYMLNASALYQLKKKHKMIPYSMDFMPIKRITERTDLCTKY